ncbi:MAG: ATP-binding protein [Alphaproteobacteria bacterium]|nr:ATP-binding protein [Alphaproteobacteria bacterium]
MTTDGGFAMITGEPGAGKSAALRILSAELAPQRDVSVGTIGRPQASIADFYREAGDIFGVDLRPHNRWNGSWLLRERWQAHIDASLSHPVLVIDEAQELKPNVLSELRLLASSRLDSYNLLTIVLAGDMRLVGRLRSDEFLPLNSGMRVRLSLERQDPTELQSCLRHALDKAGCLH